MLTLTIFTQNPWGVWLKFLYRFKGYYNVFCGTENILCDITYFPQNAPLLWFHYNVFCGTENILCDITYFPQKCATFVVPFVFWYTKMLTLTIFTQNPWGVWLKFLYRFKGYYNVFCGTENILCDITYFPQKCATFVVPFAVTIFTQNPWGVPFVFWYTKMLTLTIFTQNPWGVWLKFLYRFKGYYNVFCGTENILCDITYFPQKCATFVVPFVFWYTKMLTLTIFTQNPWGVWLKFLYRFKGYYNVFCGTENILCDITYFPQKCATFVVPFVFWYTKMLTLTIFTQNPWGVWLKFLYRFKGYYNVFCGTENIFCDISYFPPKCHILGYI